MSPTFLGSISHTEEVPRSRFKKQRIEHGDYSMLKRLEVVKAMDRQEMEATKLMEAIMLATRRRVTV